MAEGWAGGGGGLEARGAREQRGMGYCSSVVMSWWFQRAVTALTGGR